MESDGRPRGACPACLEMIIVGASTCPYCQTAGIHWPGVTNQEQQQQRGCFRCGGIAALRDGRHVYCTQCGENLQASHHPHLFNK